MDDTIYRQAAIDALAKQMPHSYTPDGSHPADEEIFMAQEIYADCIKTLEILPSAQPKRNGWVHIDDIYRLISGHSNYHGDNILAALTCLAEGKEVLKPITVLDTQPEQKKGEWINRSLNIMYPEWERYTCSVCGKHSNSYNFCPNCGADMREGNNE